MVSAEGWLWIFRAGVGFLLLAALLFLMGFATDHWHNDDTTNYGLWETCTGSRCTVHEGDDLPAYHIATQAFQILALAFFAFSPILHLIFYCSKKKKDTGWRSRILDVGYSIGTVFHVCSVVIFGLVNAEPENFSWSYKMSCASSAISFMGVLLIIVSRNKALYKFTFRSVNRSKRKTHTIANPGGDSRFTPSSSTSSNQRPPSLERKPFQTIPTPATNDNNIRPSDTNVNINININTQPSQGVNVSSSSSSSSSQPHPYPNRSPSPSMFVHPITFNSSTPPADNHSSVGAIPDQAQPPYFPEHFLTQVRPAPKSASAPYSSPTHKKVFGPADRKRTLELLESVPSNPPDGVFMPTAMPTAPPSDDFHEQDNPPPYSEAISYQKS